MNFNLQELAADAQDFVNLSRQLPSNPEKHRVGGVLTVGIAVRNLEVHSFQVGTVNDSQKWDKYGRLSPEKLYRLQADWLRDPTIISSWWTRQPEIERYGGAVLLPYDLEQHSIISFSGLLEHIDESVSLMIGHKRRLVDSDEIYTRRIIAKSQNLVFPEMLKAYLGEAT